jgi:tRNA modification GTPase
VPDLTQDTIVAISTPPGRGGIGIVRLSGSEAQKIASPLLRLRHELAPSQVRFGELIDRESGAVLDEALVTLFAAPNSYTGEDVVEIAAHGSPVLLDSLLRECCSLGARLAEPGEFTQRAFLNGRLDLTQAEAVNDLIHASTLHQARIAARQLGGSLAQAVAPIKRQLIQLIAALEAGIDFAEDDIDLLPAQEIASQLDAIEAPLQALADTFRYGRIVRDGFRLAIVGRPNAGKSSLFNRLLARDRAIVTAQPGTTRDPIVDTLSLGGIPVELVDTAGLRATPEGEAERIGIERSGIAMAEADVVLLVVDATEGLQAPDRETLAQLAGRSTITVLNKADLLADRPGVADAQVVSALTGEGVEALKQAILDRLSGQGDSAMLTTVRQHQAIAGGLDFIAIAGHAVDAATPHEMLLLDLYAALQSLDGLTGVTTSSDILNLIFSSFCIGK